MIKVYTDGAFRTATEDNIPQMGWAFVVVQNDEKIYSYHDGAKGGTNNRAEIFAMLEAIKWLNKNNIKEAELVSDSKYVLETLKGNYKKKKNTDLWPLFDELDYSNYKLTHVRGHKGDFWNEKCDTFAKHGSYLIIRDE